MNRLLLLFLTLFCLVSSSPEPQASTTSSACSQIQSSLTVTDCRWTVPANLAWDCLQSIPLNATGALQLVQSLKPYIQFQSTLSWLKNPPTEYADKLFGPVDLIGSLDQIAENINGGKYSGEYEFGFDLYELFQSAHDAHLHYFPDIVHSLFEWYRPFPLVSVSDNGKNLPAIFAYRDVVLAEKESSFQPSPITEINDEKVINFLTKLSQIGQLQDHDALWNAVFYSLPQVSLGYRGLGKGYFAGGGRGTMVYPGSSTRIKFKNGTSKLVENRAYVKSNFSGVFSGADVYAKWLLINDDTSIDLQRGKDLTGHSIFTNSRFFNSRFPALNRPTSCSEEVGTSGYPKHMSRMNTSQAGGYYLDKYGYNDVAVLTVYSFLEDEDGGDHQEWQNVTRQFLHQAKSDGKKKLIIDLSANIGGTVLLGYELFAQLFPTIEPYGYSRFRAHKAWDEMGKMAIMISANITRSKAKDDKSDSQWVSESLNYRSDLDESGNPFTSWAQKYGPHPANGDFHTSTQRWNLDDPIGEIFSHLKKLTGHGLRRLDLGWKPEDMVIIYDGSCSSTCAIFSEFMRQQAGVETIAMGGRPNKDIIQAVGGTKGAGTWPWTRVLWFVLSMHEKANTTLKASWAGTEVDTFNTSLPFYRASEKPYVNMRDGVRRGDDPTPLQFIIEPADCRLFYTPAMVVDVTKMWIAAADAKWLGRQRCIAGGFKNDPSSLPD